jgi:hypothetical protein
VKLDGENTETILILSMPRSIEAIPAVITGPIAITCLVIVVGTIVRMLDEDRDKSMAITKRDSTASKTFRPPEKNDPRCAETVSRLLIVGVRYRRRVACERRRCLW